MKINTAKTEAMTISRSTNQINTHVNNAKSHRSQNLDIWEVFSQKMVKWTEKWRQDAKRSMQ
uniref:Uncharacterized protein n=1 Tax=Arion vulgaris TaxID=1028688 RepID=A0A0B6ZFX8_9EUPU